MAVNSLTFLPLKSRSVSLLMSMGRLLTAMTLTEYGRSDAVFLLRMNNKANESFSLATGIFRPRALSLQIGSLSILRPP